MGKDLKKYWVLPYLFDIYSMLDQGLQNLLFYSFDGVTILETCLQDPLDVQ